MLARAEDYRAAGADCLFVPGVVDLATIEQLAGASQLPLNVMVGPGAPSVSELAEVGVRRISVGMGIAQAAYGVVRGAPNEALGTGTWSALSGGIDYGELNSLLSSARPTQRRLEASRFIEEFSAAWASPDGAVLADLYTDEALLLHPGMTEPLRGKTASSNTGRVSAPASRSSPSRSSMWRRPVTWFISISG